MGSDRGPTGHASDHLANERTFLAWVRTALGLVGVGFVLAKMGLLVRQLAASGGAMPRPSAGESREFLVTGVLFVLMGTAVTIGSGWLYHHGRKAIDAGTYKPPHQAMTALMTVVVAGSLAIAALLIWQIVTLGESAE